MIKRAGLIYRECERIREETFAFCHSERFFYTEIALGRVGSCLTSSGQSLRGSEAVTGIFCRNGDFGRRGGLAFRTACSTCYAPQHSEPVFSRMDIPVRRVVGNTVVQVEA